ncbi:MAG TPA: ABC transporter permease [Planctomycetota bacterium]
MRPFLAMLRDSFRESIDRRALFVLLAVSCLATLFCFSIAFEKEAPELVLRRQARRLDTIRHGNSLVHFDGSMPLEFDVVRVAPVSADAPAPPGHAAAELLVELEFAHEHELNAMVHSWAAFLEGYPDDLSRYDAPVGEAARRGYLRERFEGFGYADVGVVEGVLRAKAAEDARAYRVFVAGAESYRVAGAHRLSIGFGTLAVGLEGTSVQEVVFTIQKVLAEAIAGFVGLLIVLSTSASFIPAMLQKGALDLMLARPVSRTRLLLYKYAGSVSFVAVLAVLLFSGCSLGLAVSTGFFNPWFLACALTLVAVFAILYAVAVPLGVLTRSGNMATLGALGVWGLESTVSQLRASDDVLPAWLRAGLEGLHTLLPKLSDLTGLNERFLARTPLADEAAARVIAEPADLDWLFILSTTGAFTLLMLGGAVWLFRRRDW